MDDLVYICTKIARQMDAQGLDKIFDTAEAATAAIEEARPLLQRAVELVNEVFLHHSSHSTSSNTMQLSVMVAYTTFIPGFRVVYNRRHRSDGSR